jgi:DNA-directed RNA polymerase subunit RPC12/RpoP
MPSYTYICGGCSKKFEMFFYIKDYKPNPICPYCSSIYTDRSYIDDVGSVQNSIVKHDSELKTLGDLANRNRDKMSNDQKLELHTKHNKYKQDTSDKPLPKGMSRFERGKKTRWTEN